MGDLLINTRDPNDPLRLQRERDLYRRLLELGQQREIEPLLHEALALMVALTGATRGYLAIFEESDGEPRWSIAHELSDAEIADVRRILSRGIAAEAIATGRTIITPSALLDPRFQSRDSVIFGRIEAVLCTPIGTDPPRGVLYLQGRADAGLFPDSDRQCAELFAIHMTPLVDRLLAEQRHELDRDPTASIRKTLLLGGVLGRSEALAAVLRQIALVAPLDITVLLTGESGTGKSQLARVIHDNGPRAAQAFVEVNCGALPENLIESELFGAMPGAHSTATRRIDGKVAAADRGTLFLDEVGDLSVTAQTKLLQLLQSQIYYPLGSARPIKANVRVIAATNIDLQRAVAEGRFREDLFYRLQVLPVRVPSLAERRDDISTLARHFCADVCTRHRLPRLHLSPNAERAAESAPWPGNVRQLAHAIEAAAIRAMAAAASQIEIEHLFPDGGTPVRDGTLTAPSFQEATRQFHRELLARTLSETDWNVSEAARRLDLTRSHTYNLIRAFDLKRAL